MPVPSGRQSRGRSPCSRAPGSDPRSHRRRRESPIRDASLVLLPLMDQRSEPRGGSSTPHHHPGLEVRDSRSRRHRGSPWAGRRRPFAPARSQCRTSIRKCWPADARSAVRGIEVASGRGLIAATVARDVSHSHDRRMQALERYLTDCESKRRRMRDRPSNAVLAELRRLLDAYEEARMASRREPPEDGETS